MSDENNPYDSPKSEIYTQTQELNDLASRWLRLFAALIDNIIAFVIILPLMFYFDIFDLAFQNKELSYSYTLIFTAIGVVMYMLIHGYLLKTRGQTVGKLALGIKIVSLDGDLPAFPSLILKRYAPLWLLQLVPSLNLLSLIDAVFIFRSDKRCIHDLIAGTKVIRIIN